MATCEKYATRNVVDSETPSAELVYHVFEAASEIAAYAEVIAVAPNAYNFPSGKTATLNSLRLQEVSESNGLFNYEVTLSYGVFTPKEENDIDYEFEIGLQDVTITHATATTAYTAGGRVAPDFENGVNVSADGKVQGIGYGQPQFKFTLTKYWPVAAVTQAYQLLVKGVAGKYNDALFYGLPAGSVRFAGARGRIAGNKWPITYRFEHNENETNIAIADIVVASKLGWQYLDVYMHTVADAAAKKSTDVPHTAYVHTLPPGSGDFSVLGL